MERWPQAKEEATVAATTTKVCFTSFQLHPAAAPALARAGPRDAQVSPCGSSHVQVQYWGNSKCVDTTGHCVDTTCIVFKLGFWDSDLVSTPHGTMSTPQVPSFRTCFWDSHLVSTHRWTVSTPL
ncbi:hypothetical protein Taro_044769 [Colocasia esculenta]|uniref:Uncharacterized protein n=1 Tax=Colocasia esculenta TaxID=4460 RepID=A0A843WYX5_COLES|nr:hypothetical protein [Colocasia esculenta]